MPKLSTDYSKTIMYKLICNDLNITECYVGHTTNFIKRKYNHKSSCKNVKDIGHKFKVYEIIRANGGWDNWTMVMIEEYPCNNSLEATKRERELLEELQSKLNSNTPAQTREEWCKNNKDILKEKDKEKYNKNREKIKERANNYYKNNKDIISNKNKEIIECSCGCKITKSCLSNHLKSKIHQNYLSSVLTT